MEAQSTYCKISNIRCTKSQNLILISSCSCLWPIQQNQVLSWEWRCSWSSADRQCTNYIWVINNFIAHYGASYIKGLMVNVSTDSLLSKKFGKYVRLMVCLSVCLSVCLFGTRYRSQFFNNRHQTWSTYEVMYKEEPYSFSRSKVKQLGHKVKK